MSPRTPRILLALVLALSTASIAPSTAGDGTSGDRPGARAFQLAGRACELIPVPTVDAAGPLLPVGTAPCGGVRPGALIRTDVGICTLNFLFLGSDGRRYIGTAGHCILGEGPFPEEVGEAHWARGNGPVVRDADGNRIGEFAYAVLQDPKDFALVRLDASVAAHPAMCYFGGPTGVNNSRAVAPTVLHQFGNGLGIGLVLPARSHVATSLANPDAVFANGVAVMGDSGSGVIDAQGRAVGVLVTIGAHVNGLNTGVVGITRIAPQVARAQQRLGISLSLRTASF